MLVRWLSIVSLGVIAACSRDRQENAANPDQAKDTVALSTPANSSTAATGTAAAGQSKSTKPVIVVQVQEETPGLLAQAKYNPLDAQHIAQGKYPKGGLLAGWLERRGPDLVYRFRIRDEDGSVNDVLVDSFRGSIINSIPVK
jgi:uncharacterized membrane protein YkoI